MNPPSTPSTSGFVVAKQVKETSKGSLRVIEDVLLHRSDSGQLRAWRPDRIEVAEGMEVLERNYIMPRKFFTPQDYEDVDELDASLAQNLPFDSGSEEDEDNDDEEFLPLPAEIYYVEEEEEVEVEEVLETIEVDPEPDQNFTWSEDYSTFFGTEEDFLEQPGPRIKGDTPSKIFTKIFDRSLVESIAQETNRYAWEYIAAAHEHSELPPHSRVHAWVETSAAEIYRLIAVMILMGICVRGRIDEYYSTGVLGMPNFRKIMPKNRFILLLKFLHFVDNRTIGATDNKKIAKIQPVLDYLITKFKSAYSPRKQLSIDESLLLWKGHLSWVQSIPTKAARFGIKTYELCEAVSGYVLNLIIYTGKYVSAMKPICSFSSSTSNIVLTLLEEYLGKGHTLFMDNFYNSVRLCRYLKQRQTDVVGTLNRRRIDTPEEIRRLNEKSVPRGYTISRHCGDVSVLAWKDVKFVTTVSTFHKNNMQSEKRQGQKIMKPAVIVDYSKYMGGVDLKDSKLSSYLLERKRGLKWYIKVFRRLLNTAILNSYIIYSRISKNSKLSHRDFRYRLVKELVEKFGTDNPIREQKTPYPSDRLKKHLDHFPAHSEAPGDRTKKQVRYIRGRCARCKTVKSNVKCTTCQVFLCVGQCWKDYHTLKNI